ncbi:MAG: oligosaccharide repeat unit polymerase [Calditrichaeota bacterium]|nr:MAG: oligosaccharide repeat unit polymerase [Calditrichota bacterium]
MTFIARNFPLHLFSFVWIFTFILYFLNPYGYDRVRPGTLLLLLLGNFSVILGFVISTLYFRRNKLTLFRHTPPATFPITFHFQNIQKLLWITTFISFLGILLMLKALTDFSGIKEYFANPIAARYAFVRSTGKVVSGWSILESLASYLINFNYLGCVLGGIILSAKPRKRLFAALPILVAFLVSLITFQRYFFLTCFSLWIFSLVSVSNILSEDERKKCLSRFFKIGGTLLLMFLSFSLLLMSVRIDIGENATVSKKITGLVVEYNYAYVTANIIALDKYLLDDRPERTGGKLFRDIKKWLARINLWDEDNISGPRYEFRHVGKSMLLNTYTYIRAFYAQFGSMGVLFLGFFWGFLGNMLFLSLQNRFSFTRVYLTNFFLYSYLMSFYDFALSNLALQLYMIAIIGFIEFGVYGSGYFYQFSKSAVK